MTFLLSDSVRASQERVKTRPETGGETTTATTPRHYEEVVADGGEMGTVAGLTRACRGLAARCLAGPVAD